MFLQYLFCHLVTIFSALLLMRASGNVIADKITALPGETFAYNFSQYSGYLQPSSTHFFFYWLVESQSSPSTDPLILFLTGGPGCSDTGTFFEEVGPFRINRDGATLFENVFAWNKKANVFFIDSPAGVGFSYSTDGNYTTNDDATALDNYNALIDFFNKYPQYQRSDFYIAGLSYAGVYIPTLTKLIVEGMNNKTFKGNLKGIAIGNGIHSQELNHNSLIDYMYYHGLIGEKLFNRVNEACCNASACSSNSCNYFKSLLLDNDLTYRTDNTTCGNLTWEISENLLWNNPNQNEYNYLQDCYVPRESDSLRVKAALRTALPKFFAQGNNAYLINYDSNDQVNGFPCWDDDIVEEYADSMAFKTAVHALPNITYYGCSPVVYAGGEYYPQYVEMDQFYTYILQHSDIRILLYNGDVDLVCNFLMAQWFVDRITKENNLNVTISRYPWIYRGVVAGYAEHFDRIDLVTVKGAGHILNDVRAAPALQMIMNFIWNKRNYSAPTFIDTTVRPLLSTPASTTSSTSASTISHNAAKSVSYSIMLLTSLIALQFILCLNNG